MNDVLRRCFYQFLNFKWCGTVHGCRISKQVKLSNLRVETKKTTSHAVCPPCSIKCLLNLKRVVAVQLRSLTLKWLLPLWTRVYDVRCHCVVYSLTCSVNSNGLFFIPQQMQIIFMIEDKSKLGVSLSLFFFLLFDLYAANLTQT